MDRPERLALCRAILNAYPEDAPDALMCEMVRVMLVRFFEELGALVPDEASAEDGCLFDAVELWLAAPWSPRRRTLMTLIASEILEGVEAPPADVVAAMVAEAREEWPVRPVEELSAAAIKAAVDEARGRLKH